jgi:RHS repeat-associated protein
MSEGTESSAEGSVLSLPPGGGALSGLGETFSPDAFTGTGNVTVPIALPPGRLGLQPSLSLSYSSGAGNGPFGLGWQISVPGVNRKTSRGVPRYDAGDVFVLTGAEDLVPIGGNRFRPRTEGLFARIEHVRDSSGDFWAVRSKEGLVSRYGTTVADPDDPGRIFGWRLTETRDPLGNLIRFDYLSDRGRQDGHAWDQPLLAKVSYADHGDRHTPSFLVTVDFEYEPRPDPHSDSRAGFEIRTSLRCRTIRIVTHAADGVDRVSREYRLGYTQAAFNGVSLLSRVDTVGVDGTTEEALPPLTFGYTSFDPAGRRFAPLTGPALPAAALSDPSLALVDLRGAGLPDVVELGPGGRVWANEGLGRFGLPRSLVQAPPYALTDTGVRFVDADGDGRIDLLVPPAGGRNGTLGGYFPIRSEGGRFRPYRQSPSVSLADPHVRLVDLDGDGFTDVLRSGDRLECWFNDPDPGLAWRRNAMTEPPVAGLDLADPRVRFADMTGDGLQDLVLVENGAVAYWPNLGHGRWGARIGMRGSPRLPGGFDPRRVLLGDVDGDGAADLLYIDRGRVLLWANRSGNAWSDEPVVVTGTPLVTDPGGLQLSDLYGTGMAGLLFNPPGGAPAARFLDLTGGVKPYLLDVMDNHLGTTTRVTYVPSTQEYLRDRAWRTTLPFPVQVVSGVEVRDAISGGSLTTRFRYHHGYWDGVDREYRGFAMVERSDTETFENAGGGDDVHYAPPVLTKTWFHPGPVADGDDWAELDLSDEYWPGDPDMLARPPDQVAILAALPRSARRTALRTLRGQTLRTETYGMDGSDRQRRPFTVTETLCGIRAKQPGDVFQPVVLATRTTQHDRGTDPLTRFDFSAGSDEYGFETGRISVAVPRGRDPLVTAATPAEPYTATYATTAFARRDDDQLYVADRVCRTTTAEVVDDGTPSVFELVRAVLAGGGTAVSLRLMADNRTYFDGPAYIGEALGVIGEHGLPVRAESLAFTAEFLADVLDPVPPYLKPDGPGSWPQEYPPEFAETMPALAGYRFEPDLTDLGANGGYYIATARHEYDTQVAGRTPRGLALSSLDAMGAARHVDYDEHELLPVRATDAAGLVTEAVHDYRTLQARELTDPNGGVATVEFSPAGLVTARYVRGNDGIGDVARPGTEMSYDLLAFAERGEPASVRTTRRVEHDGDEVLVAVEYYDGFGRKVQTRTQDDDLLFGDAVFGGGEIPAGDSTGILRSPDAPDNVVVSGWQFYDSKGRVVRRYEPFRGTGYDFAAPLEAELGRFKTMFYDARSRLVRTVNPDGSEQRVVFGVPADLGDPDVFSPTPWETYTYDANDNAGRTHADESAGYRDHWNTPGSVELDARGNAIRAVSRAGTAPDTWVTTRSAYDIRGNLLSVTDAAGRTASRSVFDFAGRRWGIDSLDAGRRDTVLDAVGRPVEARDGRGALVLVAFDVLGRPIRQWARDHAAAAVTLRQVVEYGDDAADRDRAREANLLGRVARHHDEAGLVEIVAADFKGNVLESVRRVIADQPILDTYASGWDISPFRVDWTPAAGQSLTDRERQLLEPDGYRSTTAYDALDRTIRHTLPAGADGVRRELRVVHNRAGALRQILLDDVPYVRHIAYDAKGQRALVAYGNGVMTRYAHDPDTFRLRRMRSERYHLVGDATYQPSGAALQDVGYDFDLVGNVLAVHDRTRGSGIPGNPAAFAESDPVVRQLLAGGDALDRTFTYDALYRLLSATGRECAASDASPWIDVPLDTDATKARPYREAYRYDTVGSLRQIKHDSDSGFTHDLAGSAASNQWSNLDGFAYAFDANGNLTGEASTRHFGWDHADRMISFANQVAGSEPSVHVQYLYDAAGARVKKLVRRQGGAVEVTHYLDQIFEHQRWSGATPGENNHVHLTDDRQRVALVRVGPAHPDDQGPAVTVPLTDHLGSSVAVLDETGSLLNREEYSPYGQTTFGSYRRKRYRFLGAERDEESGLYHLGARYYACWLGRWISCDPAGITGGADLYGYAAASPMTHEDSRGTQPKPALKLPTSTAEASALIASVKAQIKSAPNQPVFFSDKGISVLVMRLPEPFVVLRPDGTKFTAAALAADQPGSSEIVINAEFFDQQSRLAGGFLGPVDHDDYRAQGLVLEHGVKVEGRTSPNTFYFAWNKNWATQTNQQQKAIESFAAKGGIALPAPPLDPANAWRFGAGDPPADSEVAFGGGVPVILHGLPYGPKNVYRAGAPAGLPETGEPGEGNQQYLVQRSNGVFKGQEGRGADVGKVVTGLNRDEKLFFVMVHEDGTSGILLSEMRDALQLLGVTDALAWDGSDSATLIRDSQVFVSPGSTKNNRNPVGAGFRLR